MGRYSKSTRRRTFNRAITTTRPRPTTEPQTGWYRLENSAADPSSAALYLYDEIGFYGITANDLIAELASLDVRRLDVHVSSGGGEIFEGIAIMTALQSHSAYVTIYIDSLAASIASVIAQAGDKRIIAPAAEMMVHNASTVAVGDAEELRQVADVLDRQSAKIASIYADRAGGRRDTWRNRMNAETWFNAEEAVAAGLADEIGKTNRQTEPTARMETAQYRYANRNQAPAPDLTVEPEPETDETVEGPPEAADDTATVDEPNAAVTTDDAPETEEAAVDKPAEDQPIEAEDEAAEHGETPDGSGAQPEPENVEPAQEPKPTPSLAPANTITITLPAAGPLDEALVATLRAALRLDPPQEPGSASVTPADNPQGPGPEGATATPDPWAAMTAHLVKTGPAASWSDRVAHLIDPSTRTQ